MTTKSKETETIKDTVLDDTEEIENNQIEELTEKDYSIYNYFKAHPSFAMASFSAVVAVITFFAQVIAYTVNKNTLEYWEISTSYASLGNESLLYSSITAIVYGLVFALSVMWFIKTCDAYIDRKRYFFTVRYLLKKQRNFEKVNNKAAKLLEKSKCENKTELDKIKSDISKTNKEIKDMTKSVKARQFIAFLVFIENMIPILLLSAVSAFIVSLLIEQKTELWLSVICVLLVQLITFIILYIMERKLMFKKKGIIKNAESLETKEALEKAKYKMDYPLKNLRSNNKGIRNSTFFVLAIYVFITCIVFVASFSYSVKDNEAKRKLFEVVNLNDVYYVVVHHSKDTYFLEKANITDNELTVYVKHQRIINSSDISFTVRTFDKIIKDDSEVLQ